MDWSKDPLIMRGDRKKGYVVLFPGTAWSVLKFYEGLARLEENETSGRQFRKFSESFLMSVCLSEEGGACGNRYPAPRSLEVYSLEKY